MAKSLRAKKKRDFRSKKRESGVYAAAAAGRLHRLHNKLAAVVRNDKDGDVTIGISADENDARADMDIEGSPAAPKQPERVSTHGPRNSRNVEWRISKGMTPRPGSRGINRQGVPTGKKKAGRSSRRR